MEEMKRTKRVTAVSEGTKAAIVRNSVQGLGNQPALSAAEMKKQFVKPVVNGDGKPSAIGEVDRVAAEADAAIDEIFSLTMVAVRGILETVESYKTTIETYKTDISELKSSKQDKRDEELATESKRVVGAINELKAGIDEGGGKISALETNVTSLQHADATMRETVSSLDNQVNAELKTLLSLTSALQRRLQQVESVAKGAAVPIDFDSYADMIAALNVAAADEYPKGNNIHIVTLDVPDVWISKISATAAEYTYTTDEAFAAALKESGRVQVGYYLLSPLEGQKVDMAEYQTKERHRADVEALLSLFPTIDRQEE